MKGTRVLITGAAGFIGSHLAQALLREGAVVLGVDNLNAFYDPDLKRRNAAEVAKDHPGEHFQLRELDIRDREKLMQTVETFAPDKVVHLAAMAGVRPSIQNPAYYTAVNLDGTVHLLDAAVKHGVRMFCFASSSSVYGNNEKVPFAEDDPVDHPISPYAATKKSGELICHTYSHLHGLPVNALRFFTVFGPRQRPDLAIHKFMTLIARGASIEMYGDGSSSRDYTYIDDIVAGVRAALDHVHDGPAPYRVFNLGGSSPVSLKQMIETIERVTGMEAQVVGRPMQPGDVNRTFADLTRSRTELGYAPTTSLEEGMARQWAWLKERL